MRGATTKEPSTTLNHPVLHASYAKRATRIYKDQLTSRGDQRAHIKVSVCMPKSRPFYRTRDHFTLLGSQRNWLRTSNCVNTGLGPVATTHTQEPFQVVFSAIRVSSTPLFETLLKYSHSPYNII